MKIKHILPALFLFTACATSHHRTSVELRKMVMANNHEAALKFLNESPISKDQNSKLLFQLERGLLEHYRGNYAESIVALTAAKNIVDELYTVKVSSKAASALSNDNADLYYGEKYEASLIHFYLSLNYYLTGELEKARAEVLAWDTFLSEMKNDRLGKALFNEDLLAKTFGAIVHEAQGTNKDLQIALQLYVDAQDVYFKNYNLYPTFNENFKLFRENFADLPKLSLKDVEGKYVKRTVHADSFNEFLTYKVLSLTKKLRPHQLKTLSAKLNPSEEVKKKLNAPYANVTVLVQDGLIAEKYPKHYSFPLQVGPGLVNTLTFSVGNTIQFELPAIEAPPVLEQARLRALDQTGAVVAEAPLPVIAPLGELAEQAVNEHSTSIAAKTGARVAAKHIAALVAAQATARAGGRDAAPFAAMAALVAHTAAVAAINESEKADVRYWSTLPSNIRMGQLTLNDGSYKMQAVYGQEGMPGHRVVELGQQTVLKNKLQLVMNNQSHHYRSTRLTDTQPIYIQPEKTEVPVVAKASEPKSNSASGCMKDNECPTGMVCATVRGEYPGSCAATGLFGGMGISGRMPNSSDKGCMKDSDCSDNRVCATVRGEYPGSCAQRP